MLFQKIVDGPSSYSTGGFTIRAPEYEKIVSAEVDVDPDTLLGTGIHLGLDLSYSGITATVMVDTVSTAGGSWGELAANTDLSAGKFILTGDAI